MTVRVLVTGWFSFEQMGASAGDLIARDLVSQWLKSNAIAYDVAHAAPFSGGVQWEKTAARDYSHVIFVCGPFGNGYPLIDFLEKFKSCKLIGVDLTMLQSLEEWNPFDLLLERDSSRTARPDICFLADPPSVPVVGLILIDNQPEYELDRSRRTHEAIDRLVASREMSVVRIDTRLDTNSTRLRTPAEVESLIARMDVVVTTRLHGTVLAIKNGVPAVVLDSVDGGAKVKRQAETIGWKTLLVAPDFTDQQLRESFEYCLGADARVAARQCAEAAKNALSAVPKEMIGAIRR